MKYAANRLTATILAVGVSACNESDPNPTDPGTSGSGTTGAAVASVVVAPAANILVSLSDTVRLTATSIDASGNSIPDAAFDWSSSDVSVATITSSGLVTAVKNGSVTITATSDDVDGTAVVDVGQVAVQLAFTVEPTMPEAGASITPAVQVAILDALGSTVADATDAVTVAIGANPSTGTLSGTTMLAAVRGIATFADLQIDQTGDGYTLVATSGSFPPTTSATFEVVSP